MQELMLAAKLSGMKIYDEKEYRRILDFEFENGQFEFIDFDGKPIGFFGWLTRQSTDGICVAVNNMFVLPKYRKEFNIFDMMKFFVRKYPDIYMIEWHSQRKDEFKRLILKGRKI